MKQVSWTRWQIILVVWWHNGYLQSWT